MKTAEEILKECTDGFEHSSRLKYEIIEAMKIYSNLKLDEAIKNVEITFDIGYDKNILPAKYNQFGSSNIHVNKESITSLKDEI